VWTASGLVRYFVLFFIELSSRRVHIAGITPHPHADWIQQIARNATDANDGFLGHPVFRDLLLMTDYPKREPTFG